MDDGQRSCDVIAKQKKKSAEPAAKAVKTRDRGIQCNFDKDSKPKKTRKVANAQD